ncbi:MAG: hypothetical protein ACTSP9_19425 [Promethearchaeota archaeon]
MDSGSVVVILSVIFVWGTHGEVYQPFIDNMHLSANMQEGSLPHI